MAHHDLKIKKKFADLHLMGLKPWEIRKNDRDFNVGDTVRFLVINEDLTLTGQSYNRVITYVFKDQYYGLYKGGCVFSVSSVPEYKQIIDHELDVKRFQHILNLLDQVSFKEIITKKQREAIINHLKTEI